MYDEAIEVVIIDTHLQDSHSSAIELAKTIKNTKPDQRIVLTTTSPLTEIRNKVTSLGINKEDVLVKPFALSPIVNIASNLENFYLEQPTPALYS